MNFQSNPKWEAYNDYTVPLELEEYEEDFDMPVQMLFNDRMVQSRREPDFYND